MLSLLQRRFILTISAAFGVQGKWRAGAFALYAVLLSGSSSLAQQLSTAPPGRASAVEQQPAESAPNVPAEGSEDHPVTEPLDGRDGRDLSIRLFRPQSKLVVKQTDRPSAGMPVVDVHTHFFHKMRHNEQALIDYVALMDRNSIAVCVSLDGQLGDQLDQHLAYLWTRYKDRFAVFANIDWRGDGAEDDPASWACQRPGFADRTARELAAAVGRGVAGLKVFKQLGLGYRDADGSLLRVDDSRWDPIWAECGKLGIPVLIHTGDPPAFFDPIDATNERWEELSRHPDWSFHDPKYPRLAELFEARNRVIARHPSTNFIGAHVASSSEDLSLVSRWLDQYPNLYVDISSRISELGRQPYTARDFLVKYADRVLFGTDGPWPEQRLSYYWRFLETRDEAFPYSEKVPPPQGLWSIYGVSLPEDVQRKIYHANAARLIPGIAERLQKWTATNSADPVPARSASE
ncbi:MAG: amidohydrolase family protein [Planctomycetaceae bacterium]